MVRTTVVGAYPRVGDTHDEQVLRRAMARLDKGEVTQADVHTAERQVVEAVLHEQNEAGIDIVTDGQVPWYDSQSHIASRLTGVEIGGLVRYFDTNTYYRQPIIRGAIEWSEPILADEWRFAQDHSRAPVKAVLTGPVTLASLALDKHYGKKRSLALDFSRALAQEVRTLVRAGAKHLQIDEPILTRHPEDLPLAKAALEPIATEKGSAELSLFTFFGDVAKIYGDLLEAPADVIGLDLVQGAKTWTRLLKAGADKSLVLGILDARNTKAEDPEALAAKVRGLRHRLNLGRSYLSPSNGLEFLPRDKAREKLAILAKTAKLLEANT
jgi:5-methyltetrahydropteroyltriglutamate--homocysteine methyltransferase